MIGIIVTGHGNFASGLTSAATLIGGKPENYEAVDFLEGEGVADLEKNLLTAIETLKECDSIIVFSDLVGGSPFKTAVECSMKVSKDVHVLGGTNLGMLVECSMTRNFVEDPMALIEQTLKTGKNQVIRYEFVERKAENPEEGI